MVNYPGSPPFIYKNKNKNTDHYQGIIPDVLQGLISDGLLKIKYVEYNRQRGENSLYNGKTDMSLLSKSWLLQPEKLIYTVPIIEHRSFLYREQKFTKNFTLKKLGKNNFVCTRRVFKYPKLQPYFDHGYLRRIDSTNQQTMLKMLFKHRCDMVVLNELNALSVFNKNIFKGKVLHKSIQPINKTTLGIAMRPELSAVKILIDKHILALKMSGKLKRIIQSYR